MMQDGEIWLKELKNYATKCRASRPISGQDALLSPQALQFHVIKKLLLSRINTISSSTPPGSAEQGEHRACIVFTSTCPGLVAAKDIIQGRGFPLISLYPEELSNFLQHFPDNKYRFHIHIWSYFLEDLDSDTRKIVKSYPLKDDEKYWLHVEGIMRGLHFGRGAEHLWSWNGRQTKLLRKNFRQWAA